MKIQANKLRSLLVRDKNNSTKDKHDNDNGESGAMRINNSSTPVITIAIILAIAPLAYVSVYGQPALNYSYPTIMTQVASSASDSGEQTADQLNHSSDHADIIDSSTDPYPPQGEVQRTAPPPSFYDARTSTTVQEYDSFEGSLRFNGYQFNPQSIYYGRGGDNDRSYVVILGTEGATQPNYDKLRAIGEQWGYQLDLSGDFNGQLLTVFSGAFN